LAERESVEQTSPIVLLLAGPTVTSADPKAAPLGIRWRPDHVTGWNMNQSNREVQGEGLTADMFGFHRAARHRSSENISLSRSSIIDPPGYSAFLHDVTQLWDHYRHIENECNQYLGYFFAALLGSIGFFAAFLAGSRSINFGWVIVGVAVFLHTFTAISFIIYTTVKKFGELLSIYAKLIDSARPLLYRSADPEIANMAKRLNVHAHLRPIMYTRIYSTQLNAQLIIGTTVALLATMQVVGPLLLLGDSRFSDVQRLLLLAIATLTVMETVLLTISHHISKRRILPLSARRVGNH
jgi:hypothetical protein